VKPHIINRGLIPGESRSYNSRLNELNSEVDQPIYRFDVTATRTMTLIRTLTLRFLRMGTNGELNFVLEKFWRGTIGEEDLLATAGEIDEVGWRLQKEAPIDLITVGDHYLHDMVLTWCESLGLFPQRCTISTLRWFYPLDPMKTTIKSFISCLQPSKVVSTPIVASRLPWPETIDAVKNMVAAAETVREEVLVNYYASVLQCTMFPSAFVSQT